MWNVFKRGWKLLRLGIGVRSLSRSKDTASQLRARRFLKQEFAGARGVMMKVGQLMAAADETDGEMSELIKSIEPIPLKQILPAIDKALGCSWKTVFQSIDESCAAASLGQVHHGVLNNGDEVAIKIQYPDIAQAIDAEMSLLGLMPKAGPVKQWRFDLDAYRQALKDNMAEELDYRHEAATQSFFYHQLNIDSVVVPKIYDDLCSETLLVQSWEEGDYLDMASSWVTRDREKVATLLLRLLLRSLFVTRRLHADPHMGNSYYRYHEDQGVEMVLMDYGCAIELSEQQSLALLKLILSIKEKTSGRPIENFAAMGFDAEKLARIEPYLPRLCQYLFEPFLEDQSFILQQWSVGKKIGDLLAEERWWFRSAGPAKLIFIMRAFQGLVQQFETLKININWQQVFEQSVPAEIMQQARDFQCPAIHTGAQRREVIKALASTLKVKVVRQGKTKVEVNLPAESVLDLEMFIPDEIKLKLSQSSEIDLQDILHRVRSSGIAAQQVFDYEDTESDSHYHIWLE